jgi:hypothetical protein
MSGNSVVVRNHLQDSPELQLIGETVNNSRARRRGRFEWAIGIWGTACLRTSRRSNPNGTTNVQLGSGVLISARLRARDPLVKGMQATAVKARDLRTLLPRSSTRLSNKETLAM